MSAVSRSIYPKLLLLSLSLALVSCGDKWPASAAMPDPEAPHAPTRAQAAQLQRLIGEETALLQKEPDNFLALSKRGRAYLQLLEADRAMVDCQKALRLKPGFLEAADTAYMLYAVYQQNMDEENAIRCLDLAIGGYPRMGALYTRKAELLQATGRAKEGIAAATTAIKLSPQDPNSYFARAECLCSIGDQKSAIKDFLMVTQHATHRRDVYVRIANCYEAINDNKNALAILDKVAAMKNNDVADRLKIYLRRAQILQKIGDTNGALQDYATIINTPKPKMMKIESSNQTSEQATALQERAQIYATQKKYELAIKDYGRLIAQEQEWGDNTPHWYLERAKLFRKIGKKDLAQEDESLAEKLKTKK